MTVDEETGVYGMGQGCPVHGDEYMKECSMCGAEFCRICVPRSAVCPDCADQADEEDDDEEEAPDFDDVRNLNEVLGADEEAERLTQEDDSEIPPGEFEDSESKSF
ncbi:MAG TPA: hypothetical protein DCZ95_01270 [Verrucomicrobia bacterium]|nr:MAG: hypothetical protein A2X46_02230 [Lentisphaerae bacterium GWF2_57_35]HBA82698.1 hypothetical protein [Verrucomicrobiota bacterium]